jgi:hypothetical protein
MTHAEKGNNKSRRKLGSELLKKAVCVNTQTAYLFYTTGEAYSP